MSTDPLDPMNLARTGLPRSRPPHPRDETTFRLDELERRLDALEDRLLDERHSRRQDTALIRQQIDTHLRTPPGAHP